MTYDDLRLLIDHHYWARDRVLDAVSAITPEQFTRPVGNSFSSVRDTVAHICAAERIWITRLKGEKAQGLQLAAHSSTKMPGHSFTTGP